MPQYEAGSDGKCFNIRQGVRFRIRFGRILLLTWPRHHDRWLWRSWRCPWCGSSCSNCAPSLKFVGFPNRRYDALPQSALVGLVTLTFDLLTLILVQIIAREVGKLSTNLVFLGLFVLDLWSDAPSDIATLTFDLKDHGAYWWQSRSAWVGRLTPSLCFFLCCLSVCLQHNSKTNDPKCSNLVYGWPWYILEVTWFWDWKVNGQYHKVGKCIFHTNDYYVYVNGLLTDNNNTAWVRTRVSLLSSSFV